jgi:lipid A 3-O-deacylase
MQIRTGKWKVVVAAFSLIGFQTSGHAIDSFSVEAGVGEKVQLVRLGTQWNWESRWFESNGSHVGGYWDLSVARWRGTSYKNMEGRHQNINSIGITPVFRWQQDNKKGLYAEAAVGANLLSDLYDNNGTQLSTRFEFGDHAGIGYVFDSKLDIALKIIHYSNAGIKEPNDGENFISLRVRYPF